MNKHLLTGVLLAGGNSRRMGQDKASMLLSGKPLMDYSLEILKVCCHAQIIVSNNPLHSRENTSLIQDIIEDAGPLGGIYSALKSINSEYALVLPCDMPYISISIIMKLIQSAQNHSITIASCSGKTHPTIGVYSRNILKDLEKYLLAGKRKMMDFIEGQDFTTIEFSHTDQKAFTNLNSPEDLG